MSKRKDPKEQAEAIVTAGAKLASKHGHTNVTRQMVADAVGCAGSLVAYYMGAAAVAQKKYQAKAKKLGLKLPTKEEAEALGAKLRAHGPRKQPARKRSAKEVEAIKKSVAKKAKKKTKPPTASERASRLAVTLKTPTAAKVKKSAARAPLPAPTLPPLPTLPALPPLPLANKLV